MKTYFPWPNSFYAKSMQKLYSLNIVYSLIIMSLVVFLMYNVFHKFLYSSNKKTSYAVRDNWLVKSVFMLFPFMIVLLLMYPSFALLYCLNEVYEHEAMLKVTAHQWY